VNKNKRQSSRNPLLHSSFSKNEEIFLISYQNKPNYKIIKRAIYLEKRYNAAISF
jgi:hypothetical protein